MPLSSADRQVIFDAVADFGPQMSALARRIWAAPELAFHEVRTSADMCAVLEAEGFDVTRGVAGLPTAFVATRGSGPAIGLLAEMDALPGFSQDAAPRRSPIPGQDTGHACGHHLFGSAAIGAGVALAQWLDQTGTPGQVRVYGTPAEEGGAGKVYMARAGLFDDLALALHWHPDDHNRVWQSASLASIGARVMFHGRTSHAAQAPHEGRSALHGVEAFHHMAALMREVVPQGTYIHYVMRQGGLAPNVIPDLAESHVGIRHPDPRVAQEVFDRLARAAEGAALGTGTRAEVTRTGGVYPILPNDMVGRVMLANMALAPAIEWDEADRAYAAEMQQSMDAPPPLDGIDRLGPYNFGTQGAFSTDVGDVSWLVPCGALGTVTWVPGTRPHTWQAVAAGATPIADKGMVLAAQGLAATAANFLAAPELLARARTELEAARGPGFTYRPLLGDAPPPIPA
ncbi:amidohydrolase [Mesobacterium pallidum]|uniref:amidohydrolase n=1 Tax=Mesobacterium pallidum TaxID=2872037 RepID=UPI001EE1BA4B